MWQILMQKDRFFKYQNANGVINFVWLAVFFTGNKRKNELENGPFRTPKVFEFESSVNFSNQSVVGMITWVSSQRLAVVSTVQTFRLVK